MAILITDPWLEERLIMQREASGANRYDEVWEGVNMMTPIPNTEHQRIVARRSTQTRRLSGEGLRLPY